MGVDPRQPFAHSSPLTPVGWENRKTKMRKLMGWDKDSLMCKEKGKKKAKVITHDLPQSGQLQWPLSPPPPPKKNPFLSFYSRHVMEYLCWPGCARCAVVLSPSFLPTGEAEQEKECDAVYALLSNQQNCCVTNTLLVTPKTLDLHPRQALYVAKCSRKHKDQLIS